MMKDQGVQQQQIDFVRPLLPRLEDVADQIQDALSSGMVTKGKYLADFEKRIAEHLQVEKAITEKTSAILATHISGNPCDIDALQTIVRG